jgi:serine/threonine-protein kinase ULK2
MFPQNLLLNPAPPEELARGHPLGVPILKVADFGFARSLPNAMMADTLCGSPYVFHYC